MHGRLEGESWQGRQLPRRSYVVCPPSQEVLIGVRLPGHVFHFITYCSGFVFSVPYRVVIGGTLGLDETACFLGGISCPASLLLIQTESIQYVPLLHTRIIIIKSFQSCMCNTLGFICITHHMYFLPPLAKTQSGISCHCCNISIGREFNYRFVYFLELIPRIAMISGE